MMKYFFLKLLLLFSIFSKGQAITNDDFVKLELYGGTVSSISILTEGKEMQLFYSEKNNEVLSQNLFSKFPDDIYYPIVGKVRVYNKMPNGIFPNNLSFDINYEYIKKINGINTKLKIESFTEVHIQKIIGKDNEDENKFYSDMGNKKPNEFMIYLNSENNLYRIGFIDNSILKNVIFIRNLKATIKEGKIL